MPKRCTQSKKTIETDTQICAETTLVYLGLVNEDSCARCFEFESLCSDTR